MGNGISFDRPGVGGVVEPAGTGSDDPAGRSAGMTGGYECVYEVLFFLSASFIAALFVFG